MITLNRPIKAISSFNIGSRRPAARKTITEIGGCVLFLGLLLSQSRVMFGAGTVGSS